MKYLCEKNNLTISNVYKYKNHSIFYKIEKKESLYNVVFNDFFYKMFINQISNMKSNVTKFNLNYNSNKKYFIFGCHCKTQVYLQIGLKESYFEFILDNDNNKHDLFFYGSSLTCKPVNILMNYKNPIVFIDIASYTKEIKQQILENYKHVTIF